MPALVSTSVSSSSPGTLELTTVSSGTTGVATTSTSSAGPVHSHNLWIIIAAALALASLIQGTRFRICLKTSPASFQWCSVTSPGKVLDVPSMILLFSDLYIPVFDQRTWII